MSTYIFAVVDADITLPDDLVGFADAQVVVVPVGQLAAVTCEIEGKLRPRRKNLAVHHNVVNALMREASVLPMAFGMVAEGCDAVADFLEAHGESLASQLDLVSGRVEVGLKLEWSVDNIFAHFLEHDAELKAARDAAFVDGEEPSRESKIRLGQFFAARIDAARTAHTNRVESALLELAYAVHRNEPRAESDVFNLSFLVGREDMAAFEQQVDSVARDFDDAFAFRLTGALAPYSFVNIRD